MVARYSTIVEANSQTATFGPNQSRVFTSNARFIVAMGGKRGGKTTVGAYWAYDQATRMRTEHTTRGVKTVPPAGLIVAPTLDQLKQATLLRFFEEFPMLRRYYTEYKKEIRIPIGKDENGKPLYSIIFTRSLEESENIEGIRAWWVWMDEADGAPEASWEIVKGRVSDHPDGKVLITSTIYRNSWINRLIYQPIKSGRITQHEIITWPSLERTGFPLDEWNRMKAEMDPIQFSRDYESKFVFESGLVYGDLLSYGVIEELPRSVTMLATFYGIDYGLNDPTVILVIGYGSDRKWYVLHEYASEMMSVDEINNQLNSNLTVFKNTYGAPWATYYDPAGGVAALSLTPDVFPIAAVKDIAARVTLVRNFIYQKRIYVLAHCRMTIKELSLYSFEANRPVPAPGNDHAMDALGYVIHNGWQNVEGLESPKEDRIKTRVELDLEARGLLKDGVFQNIVDNEDFYIL